MGLKPLQYISVLTLVVIFHSDREVSIRNRRENQIPQCNPTRLTGTLQSLKVGLGTPLTKRKLTSATGQLKPERYNAPTLNDVLWRHRDESRT